MSGFQINRAPVLTLWATVVAERLGFDRDEALTLGRAVAGQTAYSKGVRLGIIEPTPKEIAEKRKKLEHGERLIVALLGRAVPVVKTPAGIRALVKDKPDSPANVQRYLSSKFGEHLEDAQEAMMTLARSLARADLAREAFRLYERFRPAIPEGEAGWGAKGVLDLEKIESLVA
jgi:hypothetical protein